MGTTVHNRFKFGERWRRMISVHPTPYPAPVYHTTPSPYGYTHSTPAPHPLMHYPSPTPRPVAPNYHSTPRPLYERRKAILAERRGVSGVSYGHGHTQWRQQQQQQQQQHQQQQQWSRWGANSRKADARGTPRQRRPKRKSWGLSKQQQSPKLTAELPVFQPHLGKFPSPTSPTIVPQVPPKKIKVKPRVRQPRTAQSRVSKVMLFDKLSEPRSEYDSAELAFELAFGSDSRDLSTSPVSRLNLCFSVEICGNR